MLSEIQVEPALIQVPASHFLMGSETGQDCERPIHRVWIDAFQLAATQVTNEQYGRFLLLDRNHCPRPSGTIPTSTIRSSQWPEFHGTTQFVIANG